MLCYISMVDNIQLIRSKYASILQCLPNDYGKTLQAVQDHFTDEEICVVLSSSDCNSANRTILDFLVQKASNTENLLQFCEQLEKIMSLLNDPEVLGNIIREFKTSMYVCRSLNIIYNNDSTKKVQKQGFFWHSLVYKSLIPTRILLAQFSLQKFNPYF